MPGGVYPTSVEEHLRLNDNEILVGMQRALDERSNGHDAAQGILDRKFYRVLYQPSHADLDANPNAALAVTKAAKDRFGAKAVVRDVEMKPARPMDFAVKRDDDRIVSSLEESQVLGRVPAASLDFVFVIHEYRDEAERWLKANLRDILQTTVEEEEH